MNREAAPNMEKIGGADFLVRVVFRQHSSWQGEVHWLNAGRKRRFHSFLELALLLHQCMEESAYPPSGHSFQSWNGFDQADETEEKASRFVSG